MDVVDLSPENIIKVMLSSPRNWTLTSKLHSRILLTRENEERARQNPPVP